MTILASSTKLKIALCAPEWGRMQRALCGGAADATYIIQKDVAEGLQSAGHALTFVSPDGLYETVCTQDFLEPAVVPRTWSDSWWFEGASRGSWRMQQMLGVPYLNVFANYRRYDAGLQCLAGHDVVYERNGLFNGGVARACKRLGLPFVLFVEADEILEHDVMGKPLTGLLRWHTGRVFRGNLHAADAVICVSEPLKNHLVSKWDVPAEQVVVLPNAVDVETFRPDHGRAACTHAAPVIMFVGSFYEWHDVATLLDSFAQVLGTYPDARLVLVGDGESRPAMEQRVDDLGIRPSVAFTGLVARSEIPGLMRTADIGVAPYPNLDHEMWLSPLKLYEYMASGTVIVASAVGQITDVMEHGRNGLLVPPEDVDALAEALCRLIAQPDLRDQLSKQVRADAVQHHSWRQYLARLEHVFRAVIAGESPQPVQHLAAHSQQVVS